ncbi:MarR family winged helix-turn-helix transcriptional regulator [Bacillus salipaludis]|uniref:MarR family winged helix-turn-helix transcriptional regulator n=1 Tax=Bacillus salipaludis TaxID=2547811 RepID=UPI002E23C249|nr:MarR family transcriptional regulator [Bacillus salipaludis]
MDTINHGELLEEADWLFRKMVRKFVKERDKINFEGIMLPGFMILKKIIQDGEQRLTDLADEFDFTSGAITVLSDKLEERGFAVRKRYKEDRRIVWLDITDDGRDFINRNSNVGVATICVLFDGFSLEEIQVQIHIYRRLIKNLERFSGTIMELANENESEKESVILPPLNGGKDLKLQKNTKGSFLTY